MDDWKCLKCGRYQPQDPEDYPMFHTLSCIGCGVRLMVHVGDASRGYSYYYAVHENYIINDKEGY